MISKKIILSRIEMMRSNYEMAMKLSVSIALRNIGDERRSNLKFCAPDDRRAQLVEITKALIQMDHYQIKDAKMLATEKEICAKALREHQKQTPVSSWFHGEADKPAYF